MAVFKCKMCGGSLVLEPGQLIVECEYCGSRQTVPAGDDEKKLRLFDRAGKLLRNCEFDKAAGVFETIVSEYPEEAEAYWGLLLCRYGIEYVDDPADGKKIPTCHRSSFVSILDDRDFDLVMENADPAARRVYREEAKVIENLRRQIIEVSTREAAYDIFICYKETDANGQRTLDSVLAQDLYDALTEAGYRVFFSRVSLEDKLGQAYEPYIFAALHSAKIMLAVGTDYEHYNAVWVKNEWSRYLQLIEAGEKKALIPCFKQIDAYDMPKEFARLQAQDLGKVGATQDLLRGIKKLMGARTEAPASVQTDDLNKIVVYNQALDLARQNTAANLEMAVEKLQSIAGWQDADRLRRELEQRLADLQKKRKKIRTRLITAVVLVAAVAALTIGLVTNARHRMDYTQAAAAMESGDYDVALNCFRSAGAYKDAPQGEAMANGMIRMQELEILHSRMQQDGVRIENGLETAEELAASCVKFFTEAGSYPGAADMLQRVEELLSDVRTMQADLQTQDAASAAAREILAEYGLEAGISYCHIRGAAEVSILYLDEASFEYFGMGMPVVDPDNPADYMVQVESEEIWITGTIGMEEDGGLYLKDDAGAISEWVIQPDGSILVMEGGAVPAGTYLNIDTVVPRREEWGAYLEEWIFYQDFVSEDGTSKVYFSGADWVMQWGALDIHAAGYDLSTSDAVVVLLEEENQLRFGIDGSWILVVQPNGDGSVTLSTIGDAPVTLSGIFWPK